ncbi:MAG: signal peptide peptidase SppA [Deltaproteobacteria bacterium]|nr:signal peptide peptidase SppA [Deltaproteobacteria bacterium]
MTDQAARPDKLDPPGPKRVGRRSFWTVFLVVGLLVLILGSGLVGLAWITSEDNLWSSGEGIGVIEIEGIIAHSAPVLEALDRYRQSSKVKAIIIRIDSPGGGVAATQEIYKEIEKVKKEKKVVAAMGSVAASGGLYIASAADKVFANPGTVTGSIGVIMQMLNMEEIVGKIGLKPVVIKSGKFKDAGSAFRPMTDEDKAVFQKIVDQLYMQFVRDVAKGRRLDPEKVKTMADGRIYTGEEAKTLGLVDELGNFEDAVAFAQKIAGISGRRHLIYPPKKESWLKELFSNQLGFNVLPEWPRPLSFQYLYSPGY